MIWSNYNFETQSPEPNYFRQALNFTMGGPHIGLIYVRTDDTNVIDRGYSFGIVKAEIRADGNSNFHQFNTIFLPGNGMDNYSINDRSGEIMNAGEYFCLMVKKLVKIL